MWKKRSMVRHNRLLVCKKGRNSSSGLQTNYDVEGIQENIKSMMIYKKAIELQGNAVKKPILLISKGRAV